MFFKKGNQYAESKVLKKPASDKGRYPGLFFDRSSGGPAPLM